MEIFGISRGMSLVVLLLLIGLTSIAIFFFVRSAPPRTIVITTGPEASMFHTNAWKYAAILASNDVTLNVLTSHGSLENLNRLTDDSFHVDVGLVQGGVTNPTMGKLVSLGSVSYQPLLVFYRGTSTVEMLSELSGKKLAIGPVELRDADGNPVKGTAAGVGAH